MKRTIVESAGVRLHLITPPPDLAPFISLYYVTEILPGHVVEDWLPPEGANLRAGRARMYEACIGEGEMRPIPPTILAGPTSLAARIRLSEGRFPGVGLLPLGFAKFLGVQTSTYADRFCDIDTEPVPSSLKTMLGRLVGTHDDLEAIAAIMNETFRALLVRPVSQAGAIQALHAAIVSDNNPSVAGIARAIGASTRTVERLCMRHFGFTPQLLLRRQRFLRSLARFMVDPTMKWIDSLDNLYHDQAHFVRDFRRFMLMKPREFAAQPHPIAMTAVAARRITLADPMQALHTPDLAALRLADAAAEAPRAL